MKTKQTNKQNNTKIIHTKDTIALNSENISLLATSHIEAIKTAIIQNNLNNDQINAFFRHINIFMVLNNEVLEQ